MEKLCCDCGQFIGSVDGCKISFQSEEGDKYEASAPCTFICGACGRKTVWFGEGEPEVGPED
jgi:hypothetical protein